RRAGGVTRYVGSSTSWARAAKYPPRLHPKTCTPWCGIHGSTIRTNSKLPPPRDLLPIPLLRQLRDEMIAAGFEFEDRLTFLRPIRPDAYGLGRRSSALGHRFGR